MGGYFSTTYSNLTVFKNRVKDSNSYKLITSNVSDYEVCKSAKIEIEYHSLTENQPDKYLRKSRTTQISPPIRKFSVPEYWIDFWWGMA